MPKVYVPILTFINSDKLADSRVGGVFLNKVDSINSLIILLVNENKFLIEIFIQLYKNFINEIYGCQKKLIINLFKSDKDLINSIVESYKNEKYIEYLIQNIDGNFKLLCDYVNLLGYTYDNYEWFIKIDEFNI